MVRCFSVAVCLSFTAAAFGQDSNAAPPLEVIVVTAKPNATRLEDAPLAISALSQDLLRAVNARHPNELAVLAPNAWVSRGNGQEHLTAIRSPVFTGPGGCGNFLMAEDGLPLRASGFCNANQLFDSFYEVSEQVEVFRGPNSAVFGSNALFGGIHFSAPSFALSGDSSSQLSLGANTTQQVHASAKAQLSRVLAFGSVLKDRGYRDASGVEQQKLGLKWQSERGEWEQTHAVFINHLAQDTAGFIEGETVYRDENLARSNPNPEAYRDAQSLRAYSRWERALTQHSGLSITPYLRANDMTFLMHFVPWQPVEENGHHSLGVKTIWHTQQPQWQWELGSDIEWTDGYLKETQNNPAPFAPERFPQGAHYDYRVNARTLAVFAFAEYAATPHLNISTQLRWDHTRFDYTNRLTAGSACAEGVAGCRFFRPGDKSDTFNNPSARLAFSHALNENSSWYGNIGTAFRTPQTAELYRLQGPEQKNQVDNVRLDGLELGWRGQIPSVEYSIALFAMTQHNGIYQDSERNYVAGADTSHRGIEYEITYRAHPFSLRLAGSFNRHTYENNPDALGQNSNIQGNIIDTAPRQLHHLGLTWQTSRKAQLQLRASHYGRYYLTADNIQDYPGHTLLDATWEQTLNASWQLQVGVNNITDKRYAERADFAFGEYRYFPGLPRRADLTVTWQG